MTTYTGHIADGYVTITVGSGEGTNYYLLPRNDLSQYSRPGFRWGYSGSGPLQTALAILAHATGDDAYALRWYPDYMAEIVAELPKEFNLDSEGVLDWVKRHQ